MVSPGRYRHYKGNCYDVLGIAQHSETGEAMVVYRPCYGARQLWVRPLAMFTEFVEFQGKSVARFAPLAADDSHNLWRIPSVTSASMAPPAQEWIESLAVGRDARIERIVSHGYVSPDGFWYDQTESEWVTLLQGAATLEFAPDHHRLELQPGDHVLIPPHCQHRVAWTPTDTVTIWLAVFFT